MQEDPVTTKSTKAAVDTKIVTPQIL